MNACGNCLRWPKVADPMIEAQNGASIMAVITPVMGALCFTHPTRLRGLKWPTRGSQPAIGLQIGAHEANLLESSQPNQGG